MDIFEAMEKRHSVRQYIEKPLGAEEALALSEEIKLCNEEGGLHIQLVKDEPKAFSGFMAHYGKFTNVRNYIALVGKRGKELDERLGWYGERIVLLAQMLGLNTCWVGLTFSRGAARKRIQIAKGEELRGVIALGYGLTQGVPHESRPMRECFRAERTLPEWFGRGMKAAMLAPTAVNQQHFRFTLIGENTVRAEATGGAYSKMDLGIVKYHFAQLAGEGNFNWA